ncbi:hypothetical protein ACOSQ3_007800 [Xanthoceras sorbifolium]
MLTSLRVVVVILSPFIGVHFQFEVISSMAGVDESTAQRRLVRRQMRSSRRNEARSVGVSMAETNPTE